MLNFDRVKSRLSVGKENSMNPLIISRVAAFNNGKRMYFTGEPCRRGHVATRYVSTGGCTACAKRYDLRVHPYSKDKVPADFSKLWRSRRLNEKQQVALTKYLQECIDTFEAHILPPVCATCTGTHFVPDPQDLRRWVLCPHCPSDVPSTADDPATALAKVYASEDAPSGTAGDSLGP